MDTIEKIPTLGKTQETLLYEVQGTKYEVPAAAGRLCTKYYVDLEARKETFSWWNEIRMFYEFFILQSAFGVRHWKKYQVASIK